MVKHVVVGTAEEVLGFRNNRRKEWMTEETWEKVAERRKVKEKLNSSKTRRQKAELQAVHREKDHQVKKSARADRRKRVSDFAEKSKEANEGNMKQLYQVTRILSKKKVLCNRPVKSKQRVLLTKEKDQM
jgi:hypothetical protein